MGIVFGCVVPHPPLLIPDIGRGQESRIANTIQAMEKLAVELADQRPELVLLISPHGHSLQHAMGVLTAPSCQGDLRTWGSKEPQARFANDLEFVRLLQEEAAAADVPLESIGEHDYDLDHGALVPLHFLRNSLDGAPMVPLTFSWLPLAKHFAFGQAIGRAASRSGKRVALIASGDLSHRLTPDAPAGYNPTGQDFDRTLVEALRSWNKDAILSLDPKVIEEAGECGLRSVVILLGAMEGLPVKPDILSYEGPFGVGYLVAAFHSKEGEKATSPTGPETDAVKTHPLVQLARDAVECYVLRGTRSKATEPSPEMEGRAGVFVCLKKHGELRGCIGTFEPNCSNIAEETITNAISSASRDPRFAPVSAEELPELCCSVDVLAKPEPVKGVEELDAKRYGVIVEAGGRRGLLLPDLEGVDTPEQQISICRAKAGIPPEKPVKLYRFEVKRYT